MVLKLEEGEEEMNTKVAAIRALRGNYDRLLPRWKAVTITAEAEAQIESRESIDFTNGVGENWLPWADMKFAITKKHAPSDHGNIYLEGDQVRMLRGSDNQEEEDNNLISYQETGIPTGNRMSLLDLAKYKYHIDLGGGGGTTWTVS